MKFVYLQDKTTKAMATKKTGLKKPAEKKTPPKKVSKTWLAFLEAAKNPGIEIVDMRAVFNLSPQCFYTALFGINFVDL